MSLLFGGVGVAPVCCCNNVYELAEGLNIFCLAPLAEHIIGKDVNIIILTIVGLSETLRCFHVDSIVLVCSPVFGSTNAME